jgi:hypothetical protein
MLCMQLSIFQGICCLISLYHFHFRLNLYLYFYLCLPTLVTNLPLEFISLFDGLEQCVMIHWIQWLLHPTKSKCRVFSISLSSADGAQAQHKHWASTSHFASLRRCITEREGGVLHCCTGLPYYCCMQTVLHSTYTCIQTPLSCRFFEPPQSCS